VELVQGIRRRHPNMGGRKLYHELQTPLAILGIQRGRDRFFDLLRTHDLLVPVKRSRRRTTHSGLWRWPNLLTDLAVQRVHQAWVGDITYITTERRFLYLALLTDAYSRFIVGYDLSSSLAIDGCLRALEQALAQNPDAERTGLIHHSDHGVQYTAGPYLDRLLGAEIQPSMGAVGNCYDNALAERVNGILKCEYALDELFVDDAHAHTAVEQAIWLYNYERPHLSLKYRKPADIYFGRSSPQYE
jgi:putative transposase